MEGYVDLHLHTTRSDGAMSPAEIVMYAKFKGLNTIAITDHDTVSGNEEAVLEGQRQGVKVIPGVELSISFPHGELHLLGYYLDFEHPELNRSLHELREHRKRRNPLIINKLERLGITLDLHEIRRKANNGNVGRPHIAAAMVERGYVSCIKEAFDRYLKKNGPAYVPKEILSVNEGIDLIRRHGGIPVLAHPTTLDIKPSSELYDFVTGLKKNGLMGIEVYHPGVSARHIRDFEWISSQLGLCRTGGSDFHGLEKPGSEPGTSREITRLPYKLVEDLEAALFPDSVKIMAETRVSSGVRR